MAAGRGPDGAWASPLRPDAKAQVTLAVTGSDARPHRARTVVVSTCHDEATSLEQLRAHVRRVVVEPLQQRHPELFDGHTQWLINPAGAWTLGGPAADTGLSGRKIVVDQYGPTVPVGGGSFSGKDPTKVDRSAAYAARHVALNLVAAGLAESALVRLSYAIGRPEPVAVEVVADGRPNPALARLVVETVALFPHALVGRFDLRRPIYQRTASGGHFGRAEFPWEQPDLVERFRRYAERPDRVTEPYADHVGPDSIVSAYPVVTHRYEFGIESEHDTVADARAGWPGYPPTCRSPRSTPGTAASGCRSATRKARDSASP